MNPQRQSCWPAEGRRGAKRKGQRFEGEKDWTWRQGRPERPVQSESRKRILPAAHEPAETSAPALPRFLPRETHTESPGEPCWAGPLSYGSCDINLCSFVSAVIKELAQSPRPPLAASSKHNENSIFSPKYQSGQDAPVN